MRSAATTQQIIFLLIAVLGAAVAQIPSEKNFTWEGTTHWVLESENLGQQPTPIAPGPDPSQQNQQQNNTQPNDPSKPQKKGIFDKDSEFMQIFDAVKSQFVISETHTFTAGYSGTYKSFALNTQLWAFYYNLNFNSQFSETITITVGEFYTFMINFNLLIFNFDLLLPRFKFVHPQALLRNFGKPYSSLPFDFKIEAGYKVNELLKLDVAASDNMVANFAKDLSTLTGNLIDFAYTSAIGDDYPIADATDTNNIANPLNYFPSSFFSGGPVFLNPTDDKNALMTSQYSFKIGLDLVRFLLNNKNYAFTTTYWIRDWFFNTRDNNLDLLLFL